MGKIDRKWQVMGAVVTADMDKFMVDFPNDADLRVSNADSEPVSITMDYASFR